MGTKIVIYDKLKNQALKLTRLKTKAVVVKTVPILSTKSRKQQKIRDLRGKLKWDGDLDAMRLDQ